MFRSRTSRDSSQSERHARSAGRFGTIGSDTTRGPNEDRQIRSSNKWSQSSLEKDFRFYEERAEDAPAFFISQACPETILAIPMLISKEDNPLDVQKMPGQVSDDIADMVRYGLKSYLTAEPTPNRIILSETYERYQDPTARAMTMIRMRAEQQRGASIRRRRKL